MKEEYVGLPQCLLPPRSSRTWRSFHGLEWFELQVFSCWVRGTRWCASPHLDKFHGLDHGRGNIKPGQHRWCSFVNRWVATNRQLLAVHFLCCQSLGCYGLATFCLCVLHPGWELWPTIGDITDFFATPPQPPFQHVAHTFLSPKTTQASPVGNSGRQSVTSPTSSPRHLSLHSNT